ncbi:MAG: hypothetical protein JXA33_22990 [Anaerolineae bacterium]|nr:hypothetical protein [Anaerolineae bacterium]
MFQIGDAVVHPVNGAGIVTQLQTIGKQNDGLQYYKIEIIGGQNRTFVMMPVKQAESLGLRYAIPEILLERVWQVLRDDPNILPADHKQRYRTLEQKLDTQDILQYAEVVRDLEWRRIKKEHLNIPGRRIYDKALRFLVGELALSQGIKMQEAETQVKNIVARNLSTRQLGIAVV